MAICPGWIAAQTLGGNSVFNFLKLSNTPQLTALGGVNISQPSNDVGLAFNNPGLLKPSMHTQLNAVFNDFYAQASIYHLSFGYHHEKLATNFGWGLSYFNYGNAVETDAAGNVLGRFRPVDWVMQFSASHAYHEKWNLGATIKFISSNYAQYRSNGFAMDLGILYSDTARAFSASVLIKNAGFQMKKYYNTSADDLPFDLQAGITKRLKDAPFSFSLTAQHVHRFNIRYDDTAFNNNNGYINSKRSGFSIGKLVDHLVIGTTIYAGERVEAQLGYNFLRRRELNIGNSGNGFNGFSVGAGVMLGKLQVRYARAWFQANSAYNQFGITMKMNQYFGLGKFGERIKW